MGAWALCERATPLSVSIAGGVRVTLPLGPQLLCGVCDISRCDGNGRASLTGAPFTGQPTSAPREDCRSVPSGWGQDVGPALDPRQQPLSV